MKFGKVNAEGNVIEPALICAVTELPIEIGDAHIRIKDSPYFYRVKGLSLQSLTKEQTAAIEQEAREHFRKLEAEEAARERAAAKAAKTSEDKGVNNAQ